MQYGTYKTTKKFASARQAIRPQRWSEYTTASWNSESVRTRHLGHGCRFAEVNKSGTEVNDSRQSHFFTSDRQLLWFYSPTPYNPFSWIQFFFRCSRSAPPPNICLGNWMSRSLNRSPLLYFEILLLSRESLHLACILSLVHWNFIVVQEIRARIPDWGEG